MNEQDDKSIPPVSAALDTAIRHARGLNLACDAARRVELYVAEAGDVPASEAVHDFECAVNDAYEEWASFVTPQPVQERAALTRLIAAGLALLAVDEVARGAETIKVENARLDADGRLR